MLRATLIFVLAVVAAAGALTLGGRDAGPARHDAEPQRVGAQAVERSETVADTTPVPFPRALPRVRVAGSKTRRVYAGQRPLYLRGVNVNALVDYGDASTPIPLTDEDFPQIAALGFNVVRLGVSWSKVMPRPGKYDRDYLAQVKAAVRDAGSHGIYTVISAHSDRYAAGLGTGTEFDGAPRWAVRTGGLPCGNPGPAYYTPCAAHAARRFYSGAKVSGRSLTAWYADAVAAMSAAGRNGGTGYAGIDILNEPVDPDATGTEPTRPWVARLGALQQRIVKRLRSDGDTAPVWIQPQGGRATTPAGSPALPRGLDDPQVVYAPHAYVDTHGSRPGAATPRRLSTQYDRFVGEARALHAALVIGEFPGATGGVWDRLRSMHLGRQEARSIGGLSWLWKQPSGGYGWGAVEPDGTPRRGSDATAVLAAARVLAARPGVRVRTDGDLVTLTASGPAQTIDVWLGARASTGDFEPVSLVTATGVRTTAQSTRTASAPGGAYDGTVVRVRTQAGNVTATWSVPSGG